MKRIILLIGILTYAMLVNAKLWISFDGTILPKSPKISVLCSDNIQTILDVELFGYYIEKQYINNEEYSTISVPGLSNTLHEGMPSVPYINEVIGIPSEVAINTSINNATYEYIDNVKLIPSQELLPEVQINTDFTINNQFYNSTENFPDLEVCASNPYILRDIRISNISIYPFI